MNSQFILVFPNMFGFKGGIQVYSAFLLQALQQLYPDSQYQVLLKYDREIPPSHGFLSQTQFSCFGRFPRWMQSLLLALTLVKLSLQKRPRLMICTHVNYSVVFDWIKHWLGIPYWVVAHGTEVWDISEPRLQKALYHADRVVAVSQYTRSRLLLEQKLTPAQVVILPNTFDLRQFQIKPKPQYLLDRYGLSPEQPIILTVSRLGRSARYKGYGILLDALVLLRQNIPNIHYILVGKGDDRPWIEAKIETLNLSSSVTLTGLIPDEELCDHYNLCDVFALPSQGEGFGIVYLEAMACGKPALGGNQDGAIDPLAGGEWGSLVDPENVEEIADTLDQILQKKYPNRRLYQPEDLRNYVIETYNINRFVDQLNRLLSQQYFRS
ncbi:glycosyltransferase [Roseofilum sp. BLCC_M154]|uniref:Glycosyltransferase n=1 Tax=Roseofilum acuticapitatum BLCC-M154 TaxID=3022444 RepID=A0ABT7AW24_9CYAN|nr:glycosyltransferase [Roseofilum acuticapitatum]MDJ1171122.1 glycosyltransferase [Roseofilum acuticapitatum BLCC-M154]